VRTILEYFGLKRIKLLTNNPAKIESLEGIDIVERIPIKIEPNPYNENYLKIKKERMGHFL
jgi:GTP cyclohydrolase II